MSAHPLDHVWTVEEFLALGELEGPKLELYEGSILVTARPVPRHQRLLLRLALLLDAVVPSTLQVVPEIDVLVPAGVLSPDLVVCRRDADPDAVTPAAAVALVAEIESPSTRRRDRVLKAAAYAEAGIPSYWRVEWVGGGRPVVVVSELAGGHYAERQRLVPGAVGRVEQPFAVAFDPAELVS